MTRFGYIVCALFLLGPISAVAQVDIQLSPFGEIVDDIITPDVAGFEALAGDLGQVMGPKMLGPAETTGALGFDVALEVSFTVIDPEASHWQKAMTEAHDELSTIQLQFRKGLPYGFEVGGVVTHLLQSELWGVGMHLKHAFLEGYRYLPDLALRASVSTVLGSRDMSMLIGGGDLTVSKSFGINGVLSLGPYAGYSAMYVRASSFVLGLFPQGAPQARKFVIPGQNIVRHRGFLGLRLVAFHASFAFEAMFSEGVQTFTGKVGADF